MEDQEMHIAYSRNVVEFVTVANEYTKFLEHADQLEKKEFIQRLHMLAAYLYQKAVLLPQVEPEMEESTEKFVDEETYEAVKTQAELKLGAHDEFLDVYEPIRTESGDAIKVSIAECFADVYQDLKDFVSAYSQGLTEIMNDALYECRLNFEQYWGPRLLAAMGVLHNMVMGGADLEENESEEPPKKYEDAENLDTSKWMINNLFENYDPPEDLQQ